MGRIEELSAMLRRQVTMSNEEIWRYVKQIILEYEGEVSRLKEENRRQRSLNAAWSPFVRLNRACSYCFAEVPRQPSCREEEEEGGSPRPAKKEPEIPHLLHVKDEPEELLISRDGEGCEGTGEEDTTQGPSSPSPVKREDDSREELAPPSLLSQSQAEPPGWESNLRIKPEPQPVRCGWDQYETTEPPVTEATGGEHGGTGRARFVEQIFLCPLCELECISRAHLRTHMRVHTGERPHACPDCGKTYASKGAVNRHIRIIHHRDRPYPCKFCTSSFTLKSDLERHVRVHTGEKPYACSFCGQRFSQSGNLTTHINARHRTNSVKCKLKA